MKKSTDSSILALVIAVIFIVFLFWLLKIFRTPLDSRTERNDNSSQSTCTTQYAEPERFSCGERVLFRGVTNINLERGAEAFKDGNFSKAIRLFREAVNTEPNKPEAQIYLNNAQARLAGNPLTLATVVPVEGQENNALEILRGVADSQERFNTSGGVDNRLLEILIVNDENNPEKSTRVAQQLVKDPKILGVIGHNASDASQAGLNVYKNSGLAMITPSSASSELAGSNFFRAVFSNAIVSKKLVEYTSEKLRIKNVVIIYKSGDAYSEDAKKNFEKYFQESGGQSYPIDMNDDSLFTPTKILEVVAQQNARAAILLPSTKQAPDVIPFVKANAGLQPEKRLHLLGGQSMYRPDLLSTAREALQDLIVVVPWAAEAEKSKAFAKKAEERWQGEVNYRTAGGFDATQAFTKALSGDASRESVLKKLYSIDLPRNETSGERLKFSSEGEREGETVIVQVVKTTNPKQPYSFVAVD